ncbi:hypothetical protein ACFLXD_02675 [Chloroflexota bacterium]
MGLFLWLVVGVAVVAIIGVIVCLVVRRRTAKVYFLPKTALGKWSIGLIVGFIVFFLLALLIDEVFRKYAIANTLALLGGISGTSAFFTGIIGIIKNKDRSVIVFIATIIGFFILPIFVAEVFFPH